LDYSIFFSEVPFRTAPLFPSTNIIVHRLAIKMLQYASKTHENHAGLHYTEAVELSSNYLAYLAFWISVDIFICVLCVCGKYMYKNLNQCS